jgi:hypothetical protein
MTDTTTDLKKGIPAQPVGQAFAERIRPQAPAVGVSIRDAACRFPDIFRTSAADAAMKLATDSDSGSSPDF